MADKIASGMNRLLSSNRDELEDDSRRSIHFVNGEMDDDEDVSFASNHIRTAKYTWQTFIPLNLLEQIMRPANMYYLLILALQSIPAVSTSSGVPLITIPLTAIFCVTAVKDLMEDKKRKREDEFENKRRVEVFDPDQPNFHQIKMTESVQVGEIIKIRDGMRFPADLMLISTAAGSSAPYCYVETSNIDGETNLKVKQVPHGLNTMPPFDTRPMEDAPFMGTLFGREDPDAPVKHEVDLQTSPGWQEFQKRMQDAWIECALPDDQLDTWTGQIKDIRPPEEEYKEINVPLGHDNILLRGSELRNSDFIYAVVVYTGFETKIFMNNKSRTLASVKRSSVERRLNLMILIMAGSQVLVCIMCAVVSGSWVRTFRGAWWLPALTDTQAGFVKFFTWFIIFAQFIPISLLVSMEMVKYFQAQFMQWDILMYRQLPTGEDNFCNVQNSTLNEDLGQVEYVFSDKTGTLTANALDFRKCVMGGVSYGRGETEISRAAKLRELESASPDPHIANLYSIDPELMKERENDYPHVNFDEGSRVRAGLRQSEMNATDVQAQYVRRFLTILALNNSCYPVLNIHGQRVLRSASPDDEALTYFAEFCGARLAARQHPTVTLEFGMGPSPSDVVEEIYETLAELEFTSKRKRMSVVFRNKQTGNIHFTMKGADSEMFRLIPDVQASPNYAISSQQMEVFAEEGLRTLVVGEAIHDADWWEDEWEEAWKEFQEETAVEGPLEKGHIKGSCSNECRKCKFYEDWEQMADVELVGVTAIEDKLQSEVPQTIRALLDANIRVWVLTGDKQRTAENIGIACNLLEPEMFHNGMLFRLVDPDTLADDIDTALGKIKQTYERVGANFKAGIVMNSPVVAEIMSSMEEGDDGDRDLLEQFMNLSELCKSVIGVRLQPNQKAQIVQLVKSETDKICLSVGDGANDEPMIRTANIGVGINGVEGTAAVRASDYAIAQFRFLRRLIFVHGRLHYRRIAILICYIFYKNGLISVTQFWYGWFSGMSGLRHFLEWAYQMYNVGYTAFPILVFAVIDADYDDHDLMENPKLYQLTQGGKLFNNRIFSMWILDAIVESGILAFFPLGAFIDLTSADSTGQSFGLWSYGLCVYTAILFTANLRLVMISKSFTLLTYLIFGLTFLSFFISIAVFSSSTIWSIGGGDYYGFFGRLIMGNGRFWLTTIVTTVFALLPAFAFSAGRELLVSKEANKDKEIVERTREMVTKAASSRSLQTGTSVRSLDGMSPGEKKPLIIVG